VDYYPNGVIGLEDGYIELYNCSDATIDFGGNYRLTTGSVGDAPEFEIDLTGEVDPGEYKVFHNQIDIGIYNGGNVSLVKALPDNMWEVVDSITYPTEPPGACIARQSDGMVPWISRPYSTYASAN
jgi:hypothetical protein